MPETVKTKEAKTPLNAFVDEIFNDVISGKIKRASEPIALKAIINKWDGVAMDKETADIVLGYIKDRLKLRWEAVGKTFDTLIERDKKDLVLNKPVRQIIGLYFERLQTLSGKTPTSETLKEIETLLDSLTYLLFMISHVRKQRGF